MSKDAVIIRGKELGGQALLGGSLYLSNSLPCDELTVDTLSAQVDGSTTRGTKFIPKGSSGLRTQDNKLLYVRPYIRVLVNDLTIYAYGEPVYYYHDDKLIGKFYMEKPRRVGKYNYEITCTSAIGLLDNSTHYGGIYDGVPVKTVLADIVGSTFAYTLDAEYEDLPVYGWLPVKSRRNNLHQLLFAVGLNVLKDAGGDPHFTALTGDTNAAITDERIYMGGDVDYGTPITAAEVSEHAYIAYDSDAVSTLFEGEVSAEAMTTPNGESVSGALVLFNEPMHDLAIENGEILESGVNYAVLGQSSDCKLTGKKYTHTTRVITASAPATRGLVSVSDNTARVTDATLVSLANSENVAKRVFAYYGSARTISNDLVVGPERPGDAVTFADPFDNEQTEGFVQSMDINMSGVLKASTKLVAGYVPTGIGNFYSHSDLLTASGRWVVPAGVYKIRVVLVSGGQGGYSGGQGENGGGGFGDRTMQKGGKGGGGGSGGSGGKIFVVTIAVTPGQVFNFAPGAGGIGGISGGVAPIAGNEGGGTVFGTYTSVDGKPSEKGYTDIFGKGTFGVPGVVGNAGAKGSGSEGMGPSIEVDGVTYTAGPFGSTESDYRGTGQGGAGGGAGYGANGLSGGGGSTFTQPNGSYAAQGGSGGVGGQGRSGTAAASRGNGGSGGHGGGGGGAGGGASSNSGQNYAFGGDGGPGGLGGQGGKGSPGCALIYY